jgi:excinuclease ABC subunit A
MPVGVQWSREQLEALPGPVPARPDAAADRAAAAFFDGVEPAAEAHRRRRRAQALKLLFEEITTRLKYLVDVGIGYLTLDRQSRTLSAARCSAST